MKKKSVQKR